jgi:hypothetical protein
MKTAKSIIVVLFVLLTAQIASAYYCPSTGRWLSRDPIGEPGFQALHMASVVPRSPQLAPIRWIYRDAISGHSRINLYVFVLNEPVRRVDLLGLYVSGATFREKASCICSCGYTKCKKGAELAQQALAEAAKRYPNSLHNGDGDAFRHCYWSCEMARAIGLDCAKIIGDNHEAAGNRNGQPPAEYNMDFNNNSVGRGLASSSGDCGDLCKKALDGGKLTVINP